MNNISYEEFINTSEYQNFIKDNPSTGTLKVFAYTAYKAMPLEKVNVVITKTIGNNIITFYSGFTDSSGIIDNIVLPAPLFEKEANYSNLPKETTYNLKAYLNGYEDINNYIIPIYGGTKMIQYIKMIGNISIGGDNNGN